MLGELFDPRAEYSIEETCRPHWSQAGAVVFVTMRTSDSIPKETLELWEREKQDWLVRNGYLDRHWSLQLEGMKDHDRERFNKEFNRKREQSLDECHGACVLRDPALRTHVGTTLLHFNGQCYRMGDFIVMPNHVHLLCVFPSEEQMRVTFDSWQHFSATQINRALNQKGKFWQGDPFDHLVRSPEQYAFLQRYIAENPKMSRLSDGEFLYRRCE